MNGKTINLSVPYDVLETIGELCRDEAEFFKDLRGQDCEKANDFSAVASSISLHFAEKKDPKAKFQIEITRET